MERSRRADETSEGSTVAERYGEQSDASLVELARRDPGAGWAAIWDTHGADLHGYCLRLLDDTADADDVVADVFLVAAQRLDQLRDPDALRAWLYAISRRSVQQRWRSRSRTVPVDPQGATMMDRSTTIGADDGAAVGADDAAELVHAASAGLSIDDRELLALTLGADLDTAEVARITGDAPAAIAVRVSRLKDTVARAAGALLVARHHRRDCDVLDEILASWDGTFDTIWRKRIARHVDGCDTCEDRRRAATAVFAAPLFLAPPSSALRDRVLEPISSGRVFEEGHSVPTAGAADGFPAPEPWTRSAERRPALAVALAAAVLLVVAGVAFLSGGADDSTLVAGADSTSTTETTLATTSSTTFEPSTTTTTILPVDGPVETPANGTAAPTPTIAVPPSPDTTPDPPTTDPPTTRPPAPPPTVTLSVDPDVVRPGCGSQEFADATVMVTAGGGGERTTISWDGPDAGSVEVDGSGARVVQIGPFTQVDSRTGSQTVTVTARTTDARDASDVDSEPLQVQLTPC